MAGWIKRAKVWRKIHLFSSMLIIVFTFFFLASGFVMISRLFKPQKPVVHEKTLPLTRHYSQDPEAFGKELKKTFDLNGRMDKANHLKDGRWNFVYYRPGITEKAMVHAAQDSVTITRTELLYFSRVMERIHHLRGYRGGWKYAVWGVLMDLAAISLIVFAFTGILMWFRMRKKYRYGWWFLAAGFGVTLLVLVSMYFLG